MSNPEVMPGVSAEAERPNTLKSEHLEEGFRPIMACVEAESESEGSHGAAQEVLDKPGTYKVDFRQSPGKLKEAGFKNDGNDTYVISPVDSAGKYSDRYRECTGIVVCGRDKETGKDVSFLSHQSNRFIQVNRKRQEVFLNDLQERLKELKDKCEDRSVDAVVFGGNYMDLPSLNDAQPNKVLKDRYDKAVNLLSGAISEELGFEPVFITGPKQAEGEDMVVYDNDKRKVYITRPEVGNASTEPFLASGLEKQKEKWRG